MTGLPTLETFPTRAHDKLRYADTDRQGHVNNAVFAVFAETGRVEVLHPAEGEPASDDGCEFVLARIEIDFVGEVRWPGVVEVGTGVSRLGSSSVVLHQAIFQRGACVATVRSVVVQIDRTSRTSRPLSDPARARFEALQLD